MSASENINEKQDAPPASAYWSQGQEAFKKIDTSRNSVSAGDKSQCDSEPEEQSNEEQDEEDNSGDADVERVISVQPSVNNVSTIPNGGLWAWLQVLGAFFLFFNSW
jgi:hypothetical protein